MTFPFPADLLALLRPLDDTPADQAYRLAAGWTPEQALAAEWPAERHPGLKFELPATAECVPVPSSYTVSGPAAMAQAVAERLRQTMGVPAEVVGDRPGR